MIRVQDETFGSTSIYAQFRMFQRVKENNIKVMLDGPGADESLGGYRYFISARFASLVRQGRFGQATSFAWRAFRQPGASAPWLLGLGIGYLTPPAYRRSGCA